MDISSYIDHTVLKPTTTSADVASVCMEAIAYQFAAVCVPPCYVSFAKKILIGQNIKVATVVDFPFGYSPTSSKLQQIKDALNNSACELDMVINLTAVKNGEWEKINEEVKRSISLIHDAEKTMKLIVESGLLTDEELSKCCEIVAVNKVDFIKTSTGYAQTGATLQAVELMRKNLPDSVHIKASGGIRTFAFAKELITAGATRIGTSASVDIINESKRIQL